MVWEDQGLVCVSDAHQFVDDQDLGETICVRCGLVVEERRIETEAMHVKEHWFVRNKLSSRKTTVLTLRSSNPRSVKANLRRLLEDEDQHHPLRVQKEALELFGALRKMWRGTGYGAPVVAKTLLYLAYRLCHVPVTLSELTTSHEERRKIARCFNKISGKLESRVPKPDYRDYLSNLATKTKIDQETEALARRILTDQNRSLTGANPAGVAAAALYLASLSKGRKIPQKKIAMMVGVSEVTIRTNCRMIRNHSLSGTTCKR